MQGRTTNLVTLLILFALFCCVTGQAQVAGPSTASHGSENALARLRQATDDVDIAKALTEHPEWVKPEIATKAIDKSQAELASDNIKTSLGYARIAYQLSIKLNDDRLKMQSLYLMAKNELLLGQEERALEKYDQCYAVAQQLNNVAFAFASRIQTALTH